MTELFRSAEAQAARIRSLETALEQVRALTEYRGIEGGRLLHIKLAVAKALPPSPHKAGRGCPKCGGKTVADGVYCSLECINAASAH